MLLLWCVVWFSVVPCFGWLLVRMFWCYPAREGLLVPCVGMWMGPDLLNRRGRLLQLGHISGCSDMESRSSCAFSFYIMDRGKVHALFFLCLPDHKQE